MFGVADVDRMNDCRLFQLFKALVDAASTIAAGTLRKGIYIPCGQVIELGGYPFAHQLDSSTHLVEGEQLIHCGVLT